MLLPHHFLVNYLRNGKEFLTIVPESNLKIALYEKGCYTTLYPIEGSTAIAGYTVLRSYNASKTYQTRATSWGQHMRESKSKQRQLMVASILSIYIIVYT